jgi:AcrR family transcriptional regulator
MDVVSEVREGGTRKSQGRPPSRKAIETRRRILEVAAIQIADKGYAETRLSDIAQAAGIHLSALYYHFDTKEDLTSEILVMVPQATSRALREALADLPPSARHRDRIAAVVTVQMQHILRQDAYTRASLQIAQQAPREVREKAMSMTRDHSETLRMLIEAARADGAIRDDIDLTMARMVMFGAMNWSIEWYRPGEVTPEQFAEVIVSVIFDGIAAPGSKRTHD